MIKLTTKTVTCSEPPHDLQIIALPDGTKLGTCTCGESDPHPGAIYYAYVWHEDHVHKAARRAAPDERAQLASNAAPTAPDEGPQLASTTAPTVPDKRPQLAPDGLVEGTAAPSSAVREPSSKSRPLTESAWEALVLLDKSNKSMWVSARPNDHDAVNRRSVEVLIRHGLASWIDKPKTAMITEAGRERLKR